jgi:hypothetical protein
MDLDTSPVHRNLDGQIRVLGLEAPDLIFVLLVAATMNLFFGQTRFVLLAVFGVPSLILVALYFGKKGKPDGYLIHLLRYLMTPSFYSAGVRPNFLERMKTSFYETSK